jgi:hypothetical protein
MQQPDRDKAVEQLLRRSFPPGGQSAAAEGACLDPETLGAWLDGSLRGRDLESAEAHASECARCQALAAALVQATPPPSIAERWRWHSLRLGWLVPVGVGALAIALWVARPDTERDALPEQARSQTKETPVSIQPSPESPQPAPPSSENERTSKRPAATPALPRVVPRDQSGAAEQTANEVAREDRRFRREAFGDGDLQKSADSLDRASPAQIVPSRSAPAAPVTGGVASAPARIMAQGFVGAREIASPDRQVRWRVGIRGSVQRSTDGGSTWEDVSSGVVFDLTAGAAPSPTVCWFVGRSGTVLLTLDGRTLQHVRFPEEVDLTAVRAIDGRTAIVTSAAGRTFSTDNGGVSWNAGSGR